MVRAVVIGGGTGSFTILSGLKHYVNDLTALVSMADDGGSTGQLRDELGVLPPGDVRQCLVALACSPKVRDLFSYRFDSGSFKGHSFGNLFLTALEKMTGDFRAGVELATEVLQVAGKVEPITLDKATLMMQDEDKVVRGEREIDDGVFVGRRPKLWLEGSLAAGPVVANPAALEAIQRADLIIVAPGSLYTSLGAALVVPGIGAALKKSKAKKVYICNLVNKPGQTDRFVVQDYADELERMAGVRFLDYVVYNTRKPDADLLEKYAADGELPIDLGEKAKAGYALLGTDLLADEIWQGGSKADALAKVRTLIRHDPDRTARKIMQIYFS
ncbi:YvcK family protein [Candidatus Saccharibacteria bacterium]|nr:YvcK family protein [Candidatus Saccharibacteria bacterium]